MFKKTAVLLILCFAALLADAARGSCCAGVGVHFEGRGGFREAGLSGLIDKGFFIILGRNRGQITTPRITI